MKRYLTLVFVIVGLVAAIGQAQAISTATPTKTAVPTPTPVRNAFFYSVKFLCGLEQPNPNLRPPEEPPVKPGNYATAVNVHNFRSTSVCLSKKALVANPETSGLQGPSTAFFAFKLNPDSAFEIDCTDIFNLFKGATLPPFIKGFVEIQSPVQLSVTGVYTSQTCQTSPTTGGCTSLGQLAISVVPESNFIAPATSPISTCVSAPSGP